MNNELKIIEYDSLASTQDVAKKMAMAGDSPWTIVWSKTQTAGHGKEGSQWQSDDGGLYFSIILPKEAVDDLQLITILAAFAVSKIIKSQFVGLEPMIKLPNDVYLNNKKICGILTENVFGSTLKCSVIGIGVNINNQGFSSEINATSLWQETGQKSDIKEILYLIVGEIKELFKSITK